MHTTRPSSSEIICSVNEFYSGTTRSHTVSKLLELQQYIAQGQVVTLDMAFTTICAAFIDVNGGHGEDMHSIFNGLLSNFGEGTACAMVAQARPPL